MRNECERGGAIDSESTPLYTNIKGLFNLEELGIHFSKNLLQCGLVKCPMLCRIPMLRCCTPDCIDISFLYWIFNIAFWFTFFHRLHLGKPYHSAQVFAAHARILNAPEGE